MTTLRPELATFGVGRIDNPFAFILLVMFFTFKENFKIYLYQMNFGLLFL